MIVPGHYRGSLNNKRGSWHPCHGFGFQFRGFLFYFGTNFWLIPMCYGLLFLIALLVSPDSYWLPFLVYLSFCLSLPLCQFICFLMSVLRVLLSFLSFFQSSFVPGVTILLLVISVLVSFFSAFASQVSLFIVSYLILCFFFPFCIYLQSV